MQQDIDRADILLRQSQTLSEDEAELLSARQLTAQKRLTKIVPKYLNVTSSGAVDAASAKLRRIITRAKEIPLTVEMPSTLVSPEGGAPPVATRSHP